MSPLLINQASRGPRHPFSGPSLSHLREEIMRTAHKPFWILAVIVVLVMSSQVAAMTLLPMDLGMLTRSAGMIFRGTVLSTSEGSVRAGGGDIPTITYKIRVDEGLKGDLPPAGEPQIVEVRMLGKIRPVRSGNLELQSALPKMPSLSVGREYLLFTTLPSEVGLSTTVGLGQGCFTLSGRPGEETAVNEYGNAGLFSPATEAAQVSTGPITYTRLAAQVRALLGSN